MPIFLSEIAFLEIARRQIHHHPWVIFLPAAQNWLRASPYKGLGEQQ